uniref:Endonuclease n=1 Tax=uncultured marine virus TaxID=186617 RepID=A0A0F7LBV4_9VIRU|nr:endonuclease [uncultured marine virus]
MRLNGKTIKLLLMASAVSLRRQVCSTATASIHGVMLSPMTMPSLRIGSTLLRPPCTMPSR